MPEVVEFINGQRITTDVGAVFDYFRRDGDDIVYYGIALFDMTSPSSCQWLVPRLGWEADAS